MVKKCAAKEKEVREKLTELDECTRGVDNLLLKLSHAMELDHAAAHTLQERGTEMLQLVQREEAALLSTGAKPPMELPHPFFVEDHEPRMRFRSRKIAEELRDIQVMLDAHVPRGGRHATADADVLHDVVGKMVQSLGLVAGHVGTQHAAVEEEKHATIAAWNAHGRHQRFGRDDPFALPVPPVASALLAHAVKIPANQYGPSGEWEAEKIAAHTSQVVQHERRMALVQWYHAVVARGGAAGGAGAAAPAVGFGAAPVFGGGIGAAAVPAFGGGAAKAPMFGAAKAPAFGAVKPAFGAAAKAPAFGAAAVAAAPAFGGGGGFGGGAKAPMFGGATKTPTFGGGAAAGAVPAFGAAAPAFGVATKPAGGVSFGATTKPAAPKRGRCKKCKKPKSRCKCRK